LILHGLALTALGVGARSMKPPPEGPAMELTLFRLPPRVPARASRPPPAGRSARRHGPTALVGEVPTTPAAPATPGDLQRGQEPAEIAPARPIDLGCLDTFRTSPEEKSKCEQSRWRLPEERAEHGIDSLARLDPRKRAALDVTAADQAACLEYRRHIATPQPWSLKDVLRKGFC
jgi:hypothetical protein